MASVFRYELFAAARVLAVWSARALLPCQPGMPFAMAGEWKIGDNHEWR